MIKKTITSILIIVLLLLTACNTHPKKTTSFDNHTLFDKGYYKTASGGIIKERGYIYQLPDGTPKLATLYISWVYELKEMSEEQRISIGQHFSQVMRTSLHKESTSEEYNLEVRIAFIDKKTKDPVSFLTLRNDDVADVNYDETHYSLDMFLENN